MEGKGGRAGEGGQMEGRAINFKRRSWNENSGAPVGNIMHLWAP